MNGAYLRMATAVSLIAALAIGLSSTGCASPPVGEEIDQSESEWGSCPYTCHAYGYGTGVCYQGWKCMPNGCLARASCTGGWSGSSSGGTSGGGGGGGGGTTTLQCTRDPLADTSCWRNWNLSISPPLDDAWGCLDATGRERPDRLTWPGCYVTGSYARLCCPKGVVPRPSL
jgi:hypothetical protein